MPFWDNLKVIITIRKTQRLCSNFSRWGEGSLRLPGRNNIWAESWRTRRKIYIYEEREQLGLLGKVENMLKGMEALKWRVLGLKINPEWKELRLYGTENVAGKSLALSHWRPLLERLECQARFFYLPLRGGWTMSKERVLQTEALRSSRGRRATEGTAGERLYRSWQRKAP